MVDSSASDSFNLFVGALSLVTAISSTVLCFRAFLPRVQMRLFIEIMAETKAMLLEADQKGFFRDESIREDFVIQVEQLENLGTDLHEEICEAKTQFEEHIAALKGLSKAAMQLVGRARYLRSWMATHTAQEKRRRRAEEDLAVDRVNRPHQTGRGPTNTPPARRDTTTDSLESDRTEEMPPAYPPTAHNCQCAPRPIHRNTEARSRSETHTAPPYIPIWRRFWRVSPKPDAETLPECQV
ncbi:hypothetical protein BD779DRAFT_234931 [Infundibulicybe gibba]|nr:hypothetical protein BD779DRAFT_234931 [Infundibulicybe gibba]